MCALYGEARATLARLFQIFCNSQRRKLPEYVWVEYVTLLFWRLEIHTANARYGQPTWLDRHNQARNSNTKQLSLIHLTFLFNKVPTVFLLREKKKIETCGSV